MPILFYIESNKFLIIWIFNTIIWTNHKIRFAFRIVNMFLTSDCCWINVHMRNTLILRRTKICASLGLIHNIILAVIMFDTNSILRPFITLLVFDFHGEKGYVQIKNRRFSKQESYFFGMKCNHKNWTLVSYVQN